MKNAKKLKLVYFGSPDFSAEFLEKLITDTTIERLIEVKLAITQPDKKVSRKQILTPTPVKLIAQKYGVECLEIENWDLIRNLKLKIKNLDLCLVYAFSQKISQDLLTLPRLGFWNIHPSLLPKYRGPSPIAYPLINGDKKTGVTIIKMDEKIDHGPIIAQKELDILPTDRRPDLEKKLTDLGFQLFIQSIKRLDHIKFQEQNHSQATYTKLLKKEDGYIPYEIIELLLNPKFEIPNPKQIQNFKNQNPKLFMNFKFENWDLIRNLKLEIRNSSKIIYNFFRGLFPWPGLWTILSNGKRLKITDLEFINNKLVIKKVQLEGKRKVDFTTFNNAYRVF